jgi:glycosyltransferase involved in cell wall biosynthesis
MGKGHAVRFGLKNAKGDIVGFIDANGISISSIEMLLHHFFLYSADIIIASKRHPVSMVNYPTIRRVISGVNQISQKILFGLNISDTQVGLKLFKSKVVKSLLPKVIINDWIFDVEFLAVANHLGFKRIYESPVRLEAEASKLTSAVFSKGLFKAIFRSAFDILVLYFHLKVTRFYDRPHNTKPLAN